TSAIRPSHSFPVWFHRCLVFSCVLILVSSATTFLFIALEKIHGDWDAWFIWNMRARFFFRGGYHWSDAFSEITQHSDYPFLLPASVAGQWLLLGRETTAAPIMIAFFFLLATSALLTFAVQRLRGDLQASLSLLVLLGCPFMIFHSASQY